METLESDPGEALFTQIRAIVSESSDNLDSLALLASSYYS